MLPTSSRRGAGDASTAADALLRASTPTDAEAAAAACWRDVDAG